MGLTDEQRKAADTAFDQALLELQNAVNRSQRARTPSVIGSLILLVILACIAGIAFGIGYGAVMQLIWKIAG